MSHVHIHQTPIHTIFLYICKVYDSFNHDQLLLLLSNYGWGPIPYSLYRNIGPYKLMSSRKEDYMERPSNPPEESPRGCYITTLFNIIIDHVIKTVDSTMTSNQDLNIKTKELFYVDDGDIYGIIHLRSNPSHTESSNNMTLLEWT